MACCGCTIAPGSPEARRWATLALGLTLAPAPTLTLTPHPEQLTALVASMRMRELVAGELLVEEGLQP